MADYIVKDTELTSVVNAIRTAGGTNSLLSFPNGFISAVENISGSGDSWQTVFEGSVTTVDEDGLIVGGIDYSELLSVDTIKVTFNGVEYTCNKITLPIGNGYGEANQQGPDFTNYPFFIESTDSGPVNTTAIYTETAGTYTVKIEALQESGSSDFSTAKVTLVNNKSANVTLYIPNADDLEGTSFSPASLADAYVVTNSSIDITAILYKGQTIMPYSPNLTVTGNASIDMGQIFITGDCTITIS